jgi:hypothetical protein
MEKRNRILRTVLLDREAWDELGVLSQEHDQSKASIIRRFVREGLARESIREPQQAGA